LEAAGAVAETGATIAGAVDGAVSGKAGIVSSLAGTAEGGASEGKGGISWAKANPAANNRGMKTKKRFNIRNTP
jgi:hypothetical protein